MTHTKEKCKLRLAHHIIFWNGFPSLFVCGFFSLVLFSFFFPQERFPLFQGHLGCRKHTAPKLLNLCCRSCLPFQNTVSVIKICLWAPCNAKHGTRCMCLAELTSTAAHRLQLGFKHVIIHTLVAAASWGATIMTTSSRQEHKGQQLLRGKSGDCTWLGPVFLLHCLPPPLPTWKALVFSCAIKGSPSW